MNDNVHFRVMYISFDAWQTPPVDVVDVVLIAGGGGDVDDASAANGRPFIFPSLCSQCIPPPLSPEKLNDVH